MKNFTKKLLLQVAGVGFSAVALGATTVRSGFNIVSMKGIYTVPVSEPELTSAATFEVPVQLFTDLSSGKKSLQFTLPAELVGNSEFYTLASLSSTDQSEVFVGQNATAECAKNGATSGHKMSSSVFECTVRFTEVEVNLALARNALAAKGFSETRIKSGLTVASRFGGDPVGIVKYHVVSNPYFGSPLP